VTAPELLDADAWAIASAVRSGDVSATELLDAQLERIARIDPAIGSVWRVTEERARREAAAVDAAVAAGRDPGPLAGVPVGWKDLIDTAGTVTTYGSAIYRDHVPDRDADVVSALAAAGAVNVAKLSLHELAWGTTNENPHYGVCRNPHDLERMPGGSSGGSAAALAARLVALAPGTDTGGSIRCPASCCGIVGLKPTFGRVSLAGVHPLCQSLDHAGPMARSVRDCALALEAMAGASPRDPRTPPVPVERYRDALGRGAEGMTVGVAERFFFEHTAPDVAEPVRRCVDALAAAGARIVEIDLGWPTPDTLGGGYYDAEQAAALVEHWPHRRADLGADVARDVELVSRRDAVSSAAIRLRRLEYCAAALARLDEAGVDVVVHPTQAFSPPRIGTRHVPFAGSEGVDVTVAMCGLTEIYDVLGWPAISVPAGTDSLGLPTGCQLAARPWREADCLAAAAVVEASVPRTALPAAP
jgi:aspartyl-tRNA(Asn)/glutamyl-tRNA(Gln) amidotransferase subunit A